LALIDQTSVIDSEKGYVPLLLYNLEGCYAHVFGCKFEGEMREKRNRTSVKFGVIIGIALLTVWITYARSRIIN